MNYLLTDKDPGLKPGVPEIVKVIEIVKITEIIEVEVYVKEEYDFTWVYVVASCAAVLGIIILVCLCKSCKKQRSIRKKAMDERKPGYERDAMF